MILPYIATVLLALATAYSAIVSFRQKPEGAKPSWIFPDGTGRTARIFIGLATAVLLLGVVARFSLSVQTSAPRSVRFLIPEAYNGWVRVEFEVVGAPALPVEGGQLVLRIPPSGLLETSSAEQYGWVKENYQTHLGQDQWRGDKLFRQAKIRRVFCRNGETIQGTVGAGKTKKFTRRSPFAELIFKT